MVGIPIDANLELRAAANLSTTETTTAITVVEGASDAELHLLWGLVTGTPSLTVDFEVSIDDGSNFVVNIITRSFTVADTPGTDESEFQTSKPVYIPKPTGVTATYRGVLARTHARLVLTVGGGTPVFTNMHAYLGMPEAGETPARESI